MVPATYRQPMALWCNQHGWLLNQAKHSSHPMKTRILACCLAIAFALHALAQAAPQIIVQPEDQSVSFGANVTNRVTAGGTLPLNYQWRFSGTNLIGETRAALVVTNIQTAQAGEYLVVVTNDSGSVTSRVATLEVDPSFTQITTGQIVKDGGHYGDEEPTTVELWISGEFNFGNPHSITTHGFCIVEPVQRVIDKTSKHCCIVNRS